MRLIFKSGSENSPGSLFPGTAEPQDRGYELQSRSFGFSAGIHAVVIAALYYVSDFALPPRRPVYDKVIEPNKTKLVWYHFKAELPNIDSPQSTNTDTTRGLKRSPRVVIADAKTGSKSEFVWQPSPLELSKDVKVPNLIALHASAPQPPSPAPPAIAAQEAPNAPKTFVPPETTPRPQKTPPAPVILLEPLMPTPSPLLAATAPALQGLKQPKPLRQFVPPAPARAAARPGSGNLTMVEAPSLQPIGKLNVASINLDSVKAAPVLPPGRRAGQFSTAPETGESPVAKSNGGASVPGLTTRGRNLGNSEPALRPPGVTPGAEDGSVAYRDIMTHPMGSSMSVPLRPGSRTIPLGVEGRFRGRVVYTMVIPCPKLPEYAADWIVWFAEKVVPAEGVAQIRAPVPDKKKVAEANLPRTWGNEADVQVFAVIDETGRIQSPTLLKIPPGLPQQFVLEDLSTWRFKPATRNGVPVSVEAILDIPFRQILSGFKP